MKTNNAFRRGFTLIELMIVIVILGILMGTILPRLTGAQSRARDTARIADLNNISQALEVYFNDNGSYPPGRGCLDPDPANDPGQIAAGATGSENGTNTAADLGVYLKGGQVPTPGSTKQNTLGCEGNYFYTPITKSNIARGAYILASDVETFQTANFLLTTTPVIGTITADPLFQIGTLYKNITETDVNTEADIATKTIYIVRP